MGYFQVSRPVARRLLLVNMKQRMVNTRFWDDNYTSNLDPIEKLMFLYFITNTSTTICGIYEIPLKKIAVETGIDKEMVNRILERFKKDQKVFYVDGWIGIKNFIKHQNQNSPKVKKGIETEMMAVPKDILDKMIAYGYHIHTLSHLNLNSNLNSNLNPPTPLKGDKGEIKYQSVNDEGQEVEKYLGLKRMISDRGVFNYASELAKLRQSPKKVDRIVAHYFEAKEYKFENWEQYYPNLARFTKIAKGLTGYNSSQVEQAITHCLKEWGDNWTMETLVNWIPETNK